MTVTRDAALWYVKLRHVYLKNTKWELKRNAVFIPHGSIQRLLNCGHHTLRIFISSVAEKCIDRIIHKQVINMLSSLF